MRPALFIALLLAGCSLSYGTGFLCSDGGSCPDGLSCVAGVCGGTLPGTGTTTSGTSGGSTGGGTTGTSAGGTSNGGGECDAGIFQITQGPLYVDDVQGKSDPTCCGTQSYPCQSLTVAVNRWTTGLTIEVSHDGGGGIWNDSPEKLPIHLDQGMILYAPGIYFQTRSDASALTRTGPT